MLGRKAAALGTGDGSRLDAATVLSAYFLLTMIVPSHAVIGSLGSVGAPSTLLAVAVLIWWLWHQLHQVRLGQQEPQWVRRAAIVLTLFIVVAYRHAAMGPMVADEIQPADTGLLRFLALIGVILTASDGISSVSQWHRLMSRMAGVTVLVSVLAIVQVVTGQVWIDRVPLPGLTSAGAADALVARGAFLRPSGTSSHPIEFSSVLGMMLPIVINHARFSTRRRVRAYAGVAIVLIVVLLSISRTALICAVVALVILLPTWPRATRRAAILWGLLTLAGAAVAVPGLLGTLRGLVQGSSDDPSVASRTSGYGYALEMFTRNPWFGRGYGTFSPRYFIFDNAYLQLLMEVGAFGLASFLVLVVSALVCAHRASRLFTSYRDREMARALLASVGAGAVSVAFFDLFAFPQSAGCLALSIGLSGAALRLARDAARQPVNQPVLGGVVPRDSGGVVSMDRLK